MMNLNQLKATKIVITTFVSVNGFILQSSLIRAIFKTFPREGGEGHTVFVLSPCGKKQNVIGYTRST